MGVDMLDVIFRVERTFLVKIHWKELEQYAKARTPHDLLVGDLLAYVRTRRPPFPIEDGFIACDVACVTCRSSLRGISPFKYCPECATSAAYEWQLRLGV